MWYFFSVPMIQIPIAEKRKEIFGILNDFLLKDLSTLTPLQHVGACLQDDDDGYECHDVESISEELSNVMSVFDCLLIRWVSIGPFEKREDLDPYISAFSQRISAILQLTNVSIMDEELRIGKISEGFDYSVFVSEDPTEGRWKDQYLQMIKNLMPDSH